MKFSLPKDIFQDSILPMLGTVSNKNTISAIEGILIETTGKDTVELSSYDMNKGMRITLHNVHIEREGSYIVNAQRLTQTVRVLPDGDDITVDVDEKCNLTLSSGKSSFSMFVMKGEEFPNLPELTTDKGFSVSCGILRKMIGKVSHSVAEQDSRPMLCGAFFKIGNDGMEVVSCDSYTLSVCRQTCEISYLGQENEEQLSFIIPGHALSEISKILPDSDKEKASVYLSRKHAIVQLGDMIFFTRTIDSEYIEYKRLMPKDNDIVVTVDKERFLDGLERANIIAEEKIQGSGKSYVKIGIEDNFLSLTSSSVNGKVYDEMDCVHEGGNLEIGFNCRYLINSVKAAEGENLKITCKSPTQAITIEPTDKDGEFSFFYMILPVRMNG